MGIGTAGGGGLRKVGGGAPSRSIVCHASRSAASSGQRAVEDDHRFGFSCFITPNRASTGTGPVREL